MRQRGISRTRGTARIRCLEVICILLPRRWAKGYDEVHVRDRACPLPVKVAWLGQSLDTARNVYTILLAASLMGGAAPRKTLLFCRLRRKDDLFKVGVKPVEATIQGRPPFRPSFDSVGRNADRPRQVPL